MYGLSVQPSGIGCNARIILVSTDIVLAGIGDQTEVN